jgi:hypothetical protein
VLTRRQFKRGFRDDLLDGASLALAVLLTGLMRNESRASYRGIGFGIVLAVGIVCGIVWWISH